MTVVHGVRIPAQREVAADAATTALCEMFTTFGETSRGGWGRLRGGVAAMVLGVPVPGLNAVLCGRRGAVAAVSDLLDEVTERGLPHCLYVRAGDAAGELLARSRGLVAGEEVPFMLLDVASLRPLPWTEVRRLGADEIGVHVDAVVAGFEAQAEPFEPLRSAEVLERDGVRAYVVEADGVPVATAMGMTVGRHVGVFSVATAPAYRGRGYGAALTARAVADGAAGGATVALLQSSPIGRSVYERLGFREVEAWTAWFSPGA